MKFRKCKLSELGEIVGGATPSTKNKFNYGGNISWITPKDLTNLKGRFINRGERNITKEGFENSSTKMLPINSVLFSSRAPIGYIAINNMNEVCTNQGFKSIIPNDKINYMFLYYLLKFNKDRIESLGSGTTFKEISGAVMKNIVVSIPENKNDQLKIAKVLSKIDEKIELNTHINNNLYEIIKVQYNNFMSKITKYDLVKLKDIAIISSGKRPKNKGKEYKIPLIGASGIMSYTEDYNSDSDILVIGRVGTLGVVQRYFDKVWLSDNTISIKTEYINTLESYLRYVDYQSLNRGSTQPLITQTDINNLEIKFRKNEFVKFENEVKELRNRIVLNNMQNKVIEKVRDTLLPKLMNGEIDLDKIEI